MEILKKCTYCKKEKLLVDFSSDRTRIDGLDNHCRACKSVFKSRYSELLRRDSMYEINRRIKNSTSRFFCRLCDTALQTRGLFYDFCISCVPAIKTNITYCKFCKCVIPVKEGYICKSDKCQLLYKKERTNKVKSIASEYKKRFKKKGCVICGYSKCMSALEFHHLDSKKGKTISQINSLPRLLRELEENDVVVLCANCHREVHAGLAKEELLFKEMVIL